MVSSWSSAFSRLHLRSNVEPCTNLYMYNREVSRAVIMGTYEPSVISGSIVTFFGARLTESTTASGDVASPKSPTEIGYC